MADSQERYSVWSVGLAIFVAGFAILAWLSPGTGINWEGVAAVAATIVALAVLFHILVRWLLHRALRTRDQWREIQANNLEAILDTHVGEDQREAIRQKLFAAEKKSWLSRSQKYQFYGEVSKVCSASGLVALSWFMRENLHRFSPDQMKKYEAAFPQKKLAAGERDQRTDEEKQLDLRAEVDRLLCLVTHAWQAKLENETLRATLAIGTAGMTTLITAVFLCWLTLGLYNTNVPFSRASVVPPPLLVAALFAGTLGGFVSVQRRLHDASTEGAPLAESPRLAVTSIVTAPVLGAIGALLVYVLMSGNLVNGALFPEFEEAVKPRPPGNRLAAATVGPGPEPVQKSVSEKISIGQIGTKLSRDGNGISFVDYVKTDSVKKNSDLAKLLFWCFVAGFLERFVPDTISNLLGKATAPS